MADKPILFSGPMVRALLAGTKTQTRRAIKWNDEVREPPYVARYAEGARIVWCEGDDVWTLARTHAVGDRLYVREHWRTVGSSGQFDDVPPRDMYPQAVWYVADGEAPANEFVGKHRQAMHMPRWASRLTLTVTDVRVERLQDISVEDAVAEGALASTEVDQFAQVHAIQMYRAIWTGINGEGSWEANPWVAAYTFTVERGNIDQLARAA